MTQESVACGGRWNCCVLASMLFGTQPRDAATYAAMAMLLVAVALAAGYLPAWRASRINPMVALRTN